jgi:hypothetical protein
MATVLSGDTRTLTAPRSTEVLYSLPSVLENFTRTSVSSSELGKQQGMTRMSLNRAPQLQDYQ